MTATKIITVVPYTEQVKIYTKMVRKFNRLSKEEKESDGGKQVHLNLLKIAEGLKQMEAAVPRDTRGGGNYTSKILNPSCN